MSNLKNLLLIGPYTEIGGVSIHIRRLEKMMINNGFNIQIIDESKLSFSDNSVYNFRRFNPIKYFELILKSDIIHIHSPNNLLRFIHLFAGRLLFKKVVISIHSLTQTQSKWKIFFLKILCNFFNDGICVNVIIQNKIKVFSFKIIPAFLPPIMETEIDLPKKLEKLLIRRSEEKIIVSNAYKLVEFNNNDLYGFDLLLDVAREIKRRKDNFRLILVVSSLDKNNLLYKGYIKTIEEENLFQQIYIFTKVISFVKLIQESDLVVRATNTDGDSLSIREAIYLKVPVIASDIVERPKGVFTFKNRNSFDLYNVIKKCLTDLDNPPLPESKNYYKLYNDFYLLS